MDLSQFFTSADLAGITPEIILTITALMVLTLDIVRITRPRLNLLVASIGLITAGYVISQIGGDERSLFGGMLLLNKFTIFLDILYLVVGLTTLVFSQGYLEKRGVEARGEYPALILFSVIGMMLMTQANDLVMTFLGLELLSLSLYVLVGFLRHNILSNEAGLKYLLLGAFSTGFFLFGAALIYGTTGSTNFNNIASAISLGAILSNGYLYLGIGLLLIGFAFKVALVPFHMWSPDVYQGAPTIVTAFLCTAPKAAGFGALLKVLIIAFPEVYSQLQNIFWILAVLTMSVGNISALMQSNVKRMLAFSSISHAGYLVLGVMVFDSVGLSAVLFYLIIYSVMNLGSFAIIAMAEKEESGLEFEDYRGLAARHPWLAAAMTLFMISLAGFPPTAGFIAKYGLFSAAVANGYIWLVVIAVINTLVSVYYYTRLIVNMYMEEEGKALYPVYAMPARVLIGILAIFIIIFGVAPDYLLEMAAEAGNMANFLFSTH